MLNKYLEYLQENLKCKMPRIPKDVVSVSFEIHFGHPTETNIMAYLEKKDGRDFPNDTFQLCLLPVKYQKMFEGKYGTPKYKRALETVAKEIRKSIGNLPIKATLKMHDTGMEIPV